jgi:hypothetical protein
MIIKLQGFQLVINSKLNYKQYSLNSFYSDLINLNLTSNPFLQYKRILCINNKSNDNYVLGLLVTVKDEKRFLEYKDNVISINEVTEGASLAEFNHFVINKKTNKGIYQYHNNSLSLEKFCTLLESKYDEKRTDTKREAIFEAEALYKRGTFLKLLEEFSEIKNIKMKFNTYKIKRKKGVAKPGRITRESEIKTISFDKGGLKSKLKFITNLVNKYTDKNFSARVFDDKIKAYKTFHMYKNIDDFGAYDYEDISNDFKLKLEVFEESDILKILISVANKEPIISEI